MKPIDNKTVKKMMENEPIKDGLKKDAIAINFPKEEYEWLLFDNDGSINLVLDEKQKTELTNVLLEGGQKTSTGLFGRTKPVVDNDLDKLKKYLRKEKKNIDELLYKPVDKLDNLLGKIGAKIDFSLIEDLVNNYPNSNLLKALTNKMCVENDSAKLDKLYKLLLNKYMGKDKTEIYEYVLLNSKCGLSVNNNLNEFIKLYANILNERINSNPPLIRKNSYSKNAEHFGIILRNKYTEGDVPPIKPKFKLDNTTISSLKELYKTLKNKSDFTNPTGTKQYIILNKLTKKFYNEDLE